MSIILVVQGAVDKFIAKYLPAHRKGTIGAMIKSVDESIDAKLLAHDRLRDDQTSTYSKEVMKEIESLQVENQALKAHLVN